MTGSHRPAGAPFQQHTHRPLLRGHRHLRELSAARSDGGESADPVSVEEYYKTKLPDFAHKLCIEMAQMPVDYCVLTIVFCVFIDRHKTEGSVWECEYVVNMSASTQSDVCEQTSDSGDGPGRAGVEVALHEGGLEVMGQLVGGQLLGPGALGKPSPHPPILVLLQDRHQNNLRQRWRWWRRWTPEHANAHTHTSAYICKHPCAHARVHASHLQRPLGGPCTR